MPTFDFTAPDGTTHSIEGPEGATREQAFQMLKLKLGGAAPAAPQVGYGEDAAKSAASGLAQGAATAIGFPGDVAGLVRDVVPESVRTAATKIIPGGKLISAIADHLPTKQSLLDGAKDDPLVNYDPQYASGRYTKAIASAAGPGLATGMGVVPTVAGAVTGQAAYDATGSHLVEAGGNLAGSIAAPLALARVSRQALMPLLDSAQVKAASNAAYADPLLRDTRISPQAAQGVAGDMDTALNAARSRFSPEDAPKVQSAIENLGAGPTVGPPAPVSVEDLHLLRKRLGKIGQETKDFKPTEQAVAAGTAKRVLDRYLDNIPSRDVTSGNPIDAIQSLRDANANWRAASNAKKVDDLIGNAITDNAGAASGMNLGNKIRQSFRPLLRNDAAKLRAMGHGDDIINAVSQVNAGDFTTNALRHASNMLGGGGGIAGTIIGHGISSGVGGTAGYHEGGIPGMVAGTILGAAPGQLLRIAANRRTLNAARAVQDQLLSRAPANAGIVARNNAINSATNTARNAAVVRALLASGMRLNSGQP